MSSELLTITTGPVLVTDPAFPAPAVKRFLDFVFLECGLAGSTVEAYKRDLREFTQHLERLAVDLRDVTIDDVQAHVMVLHERRLSVASIARRLSMTCTTPVSPSWREFEGIHMARPHHREVPPIESRDFGQPKTLGGSHHRAIHGAEWQVPISGHQLGDPQPVPGRDRLDEEVSRCQVPQKLDLGLGTQPGADVVHDFCDHERRHDQCSRVIPEQVEAGSMVPIICVDIGV